MSNHDQEMLSRALRERSDDMAGSRLDLDGVRGRARGIRRRTASGIAVAAVALAVAVPMGANLTVVDRGQQPPIASQAPSPTTTDASDPVEPTVPVEVEIDAAAAPRGQDPAILYTAGTTLHRPDGSELELPKQYSSLLPYADGVMGFFGPDGTTDLVGADGRLTQEYPGMSGAISSDGERLATWVAATGGVDLALWPREGVDPDTGYTSNVVALEGDLQLAGFVGPETVAYNLTVLNNRGASQTAYVTDWTSEPRELTSVLDVRTANDVTGHVAGMSKIDDLEGEYCAAVVEAATDTVVWDTCEYRLDAFSPDGRYVLAVDPQVDGLGTNATTVLDAETGEVVREFTTPRGSWMQDTVWESATTFLTPVMQDGTWTLVRLRVDGTVEKALNPTTKGLDDSSLWRFQITP